jgi:predicted MFS family arabinose efflux permease
MNPSLLWLAAALFTWGIGEGMFFYFQPIYLAQLGANPVQIGAILGAAGIAMMLAHIPAGALTDKIGARPLLRSAWLLGLLAAWLMAAAQSLPLFIAGMLLYGFTAFVAAPLNTYVTAARGPWSIGRALTLISATFNLGIFIGPLLGGYLGDQYGLRTVYFVAASIFIFSTTLIFFLSAQPISPPDPADPPASLLKNPAYLGYLAFGFFIMLALYLPQPFSPKFLQEIRGLSLAQIGLLGSIGGLGNTTLNYLLGHIKNPRYGFILGQATVALFAFILWQFSALPLLMIAYFIFGGSRAARTLYIAQIRPLVHPSQLGLAYGIAETIGSLVIATAPVMVGFLYNWQPISIYPVSLAAVTIGMLLTLVLHKQTP